MDRVAAFRSFIEKSPSDPFPRYGLAMELKNQGKLVEASDAFADLIRTFPDYVPTYLMAGNTASALGLPDQARDIYTRGIATARARGDQHAAKELEAALAELD